MKDKNYYLGRGFSFKCSSIVNRGKTYINLEIFYWDLDIYFHRLHPIVDCEKLFIKICQEYEETNKN